MHIYTQFVTSSQLISPVNGYTCRRITKQNIKQFGFDSIDELHRQFPEFPLICSDYQSSIGKDPKGLKRKGIDRKNFYLRINKKNQETVERISYAKSPKKCEKCNTFISFEMRNGRFCSRSCSNKRTVTEEMKRNLSSKLSKPIPVTNCKNCNKEFQHKKRKFCCDFCLKQHKRRNKSELANYRSDCAFVSMFTIIPKNLISL